MTNEELIECLRCENENYGDCSLHESDCKYRFGIYCAYRQMMLAAADALEAADKRIVNLLTALHLANEKLAYVDCQPYTELDGEEMIEDWVKTLVYEELKTQLPKEGEWIEVHDWLHIPQEERGTYRCSACGQVMKYPWNYCPNCGAKMRGEHDEQADC